MDDIGISFYCCTFALDNQLITAVMLQTYEEYRKTSETKNRG